jgi:hypothetical protein
MIQQYKRPRHSPIFLAALATLGFASECNADIAGFGGNGAGYTLNGGATVTSDALSLTDALNGEARSAFFNTQQSYTTGGWTASFTYTSPTGTAGSPADGAAFILQNDPRGPAALGGGGGSLGYSGFVNSASIQLNLFSGGGGVGTNFAKNAPTQYITTSPVVLASNGNPINVLLTYDGANTLVEQLTDTVAATTFTQTYAVHAADFGGNNYYVGFAGATGGFNAAQQISNFTFATHGAAGVVNVGIIKAADTITGSSTNFPAAEIPAGATDFNSNTKYLNFDKLNTGFTVTPSVGSTIATDLELVSANDSPERDPASFILNGSNNGGATFTLIAAGTIPVFTGRFTEQDIPFANTTAYSTYQIIFPTVKTP